MLPGSSVSHKRVSSDAGSEEDGPDWLYQDRGMDRPKREEI